MERAKFERMHAIEDRMWRRRGLTALAPAPSSAHASLLSVHDRCVHNVCSFTRSRAHGLVTGLGFRVLKSLRWNMLLFHQMPLHRPVERDAAERNVHGYSRGLDVLFSAVRAVEQVAIMVGFRSAFGWPLVGMVARDG